MTTENDEAPALKARVVELEKRLAAQVERHEAWKDASTIDFNVSETAQRALKAEVERLEADFGRLKAGRSVEPGANPRFYQSYVDSTHKVLDPTWEWRGLSVLGAAQYVVGSLEEALGLLREDFSMYEEQEDVTLERPGSWGARTRAFLTRHTPAQEGSEVSQ